MTAGQAELCPEAIIPNPTMEKETVEEFKAELYLMQEARRKIVRSITSKSIPDIEDINVIRNTLSTLEDPRTNSKGQRIIISANQSIAIDIRDEIAGLNKDIMFVEHLLTDASAVKLPEILAPFHPVSVERFNEEVEKVLIFLNHLVDNSLPVKPVFITDWDGTMKSYCAQYATNLQPVYSAIGMSEFALRFTRLSAVLTAGPLRGPGILDLTSLPINNGPIVFSGSWGREWMLNGRRVLYDDEISEDGHVALGRLSEEMNDLLEEEAEFSQFRLVGSGVQRKVDRITLGVQTVFNQVNENLSLRYQNAVRERMHRVDPSQQVLLLEAPTPYEVEVCLHHGEGTAWDKANGIERLLEATHKDLNDGRVLIAGDTKSDLPMVQYAMQQNPTGTYALFVGQEPALENEVRRIVGDDSRVCYIACPDVFHAALAQFLGSQDQLD